MHEIRPSEFVNYHHVQELDGLEMLKASYQHTQFSKHTHEGYCIGLIDEDAQSFLHQEISILRRKAILFWSMLMRYIRVLLLLKLVGVIGQFIRPLK